MQASGPDFEDVQERLADLLASGDIAALEEAVSEIHPSDLADLVEGLADEEQVRILSALPAELASDLSLIHI